MSILLELDERGRITIPKEWREALQFERVVAIRTNQTILLFPVPGDPLTILDGCFTTNKTTKDLRKQAEKLFSEEK
jgi:AbrB family looped-hinge helix DNA binding protein